MHGCLFCWRTIGTKRYKIHKKYLLEGNLASASTYVYHRQVVLCRREVLLKKKHFHVEYLIPFVAIIWNSVSKTSQTQLARRLIIIFNLTLNRFLSNGGVALKSQESIIRFISEIIMQIKKGTIYSKECERGSTTYYLCCIQWKIIVPVFLYTRYTSRWSHYVCAAYYIVCWVSRRRFWTSLWSFMPSSL